jgi:hypothetical protein
MDGKYHSIAVCKRSGEDVAIPVDVNSRSIEHCLEAQLAGLSRHATQDRDNAQKTT